MEKVARSVLTEKLFGKKDKRLEEGPDLPLDLTVEFGPQFHVEHRVKQVFGTMSFFLNYKFTFKKHHRRTVRGGQLIYSLKISLVRW
jgi:hypothetical protein